MRKILCVLLCGIFLFGVVGCSKDVRNENNVEEINTSKVSAEHIAVLESNKTYEEMDSSERTRAVEITEDYWDELSEEEQSKYEERREYILKTKEEAVAKWNAEKKAQIDSEYSHVSVAENKEEAIQNVESLIISELNTTQFEGAYDINTYESYVNINFDDSIKLSDVTKGELTTITRSIYDYYTENGLARTETSVNTISVYFTIEGEKFTSRWTLGKSPEDDWNK